MNRYGGRAAALMGRAWLGFAVGKIAADVAWYATEASARRGVAWTAAAARPATPYLLLDLARARDSFAELATALPAVAVHYAVKANPDPRLLACRSTGRGHPHGDGARAVRLLQGPSGSPGRGGDRARIRRYGRLVPADEGPKGP